jgi:hypothetical protein
MLTPSKFFRVLFNAGEGVCFSYNVYGTQVTSLPAFEELDEWPLPDFFVINPLVESRSDANVAVYRNILIEIDTISVLEQLNFINSIGMPYSTATFSGGKSIHYIISLEIPLDAEDYRVLVQRVYKKLNLLRPNTVDPSNKNPSRFSRSPNAIRKGNNKVQELIYVGTRIQNRYLEDWIGPQIKVPSLRQRTVIIPSTASESTRMAYLFPSTRYFLANGADVGERNSKSFKAACDLARVGFSEVEAIDLLTPPSGLDYPELSRTVASAYKKVKKV